MKSGRGMKLDKSHTFRFGISPINWVNEDVLELGDHYTCEDVLSDMQKLGFEGTEFCRKFPRDVKILKKILADKGLVLTSQWKSVLFSDLNFRERELQAFKEHTDFLKAMGCQYVVACEISNSFQDPRKKGNGPVAPLTDEEWNNMVDGLHEAGKYCRDNGMQLVYHYHAGTVVEKPQEIRRLMETTDPELVNLLYDTGHAYYGGSDPLELLQTYFDRIKYIHLKDVRQEVLDWTRKNQIPFTTAIPKGLYTVPGDGCIDFKPILKELIERKYEGWLIIEAEQDPSLANPYEYALKAKEYIHSLLSHCTVS
jgi:inosose dehydratase